MPEQGQQNDNGQWNAQQPKQYASSETHQPLLTVSIGHAVGRMDAAHQGSAIALSAKTKVTVPPTSHPRINNVRRSSSIA